MKKILPILLLVLNFGLIRAQDVPSPWDTVAYQNYIKSQAKYKTKLGKSLIVPSIMIATGLSFIGDFNPVYNSNKAKRDIRKHFSGFNNSLDDYLIFAPYAEFGILTLLKIKCKNDFINTTILIVKSELFMTAMVFPTKYLSHQLRPDSSDYHSLPSGHTASAFVAATIVHKEFRHLGPWYGVGAYTLATGVAAFRMLNNKHWLSDVVTGAGIGVLAAHLAYATHRHRWGKDAICVVPLIDKKNKGVLVAMRF